MADEYIRLDTTIIAIDNLINEAATGTMARTLFKAKDTIYSQQRYFTDVQPINQWISVKDRLPKCIHGSSDSVLVHRDNGECEVAYLVYDHDDGFYWYTQDERTSFEFDGVTHWMPLPEPPKDGDTE